MGRKAFRVHYTSVGISHEGKLLVTSKACFVGDKRKIYSLVNSWNAQGKRTNNHYYINPEQAKKNAESTLECVCSLDYIH